MKKIIIILLCFMLFACSNDKAKSLWPCDNVIEYSLGNIVSVKNEEIQYEIKIDNTSKEDYNNYISALESVSYVYYEAYGNQDNNIWTGTDNNMFVEANYINESEYEGYNVVIKIFKTKPTDWK